MPYYAESSPSLNHVLHYAPITMPAQQRVQFIQTYILSDIVTCSLSDLRAQGVPLETATYLKNQMWPEVALDLTWANDPAHHLVQYDDALYPPLLKEIRSAPFLLYAVGDLALLNSPQIAMVGTRKPTINGAKTAKQFAQALARVGLTVTSGLALGIDAMSHEGALAEQGRTIAVLGHGMNHRYPRQHVRLFEQIQERGLLLSEFSPDTGPHARHFPQRNRVISGLSLATLVVEAALKSGSLITARLANEQGRDVLAIPGSIHHPQSRGCHALIKEGAKLIETVQDILDELPALFHFQSFSASTALTGQEKEQNLDKKLSTVLQYVDYDLTSFDAILERSGQPQSVLFSALVQLELAGHLVSTPLGYTRISHPVNNNES